MAQGWTNKGVKWMADILFRNGTEPTNFYVALVTSAAAPTADTNKMGDLTEITAGNGYTQGGYSLTRNSTDFDTLTEDDTGDQGLVKIKDVTWTASAGTLPASGSGARYAVLTMDMDDSGVAATAASGNRVVIAYWDLSSDRSLASGQVMTLVDLTLGGTN
jgi:hypothetical protein